MEINEKHSFPYCFTFQSISSLIFIFIISHFCPKNGEPIVYMHGGPSKCPTVLSHGSFQRRLYFQRNISWTYQLIISRVWSNTKNTRSVFSDKNFKCWGVFSCKRVFFMKNFQKYRFYKNTVPPKSLGQVDHPSKSFGERYIRKKTWKLSTRSFPSKWY